MNFQRKVGPDDGAMLIIALVIITTVATVTGAMLTLGGSKLAATTALRGVAGTSYAADAAAKVAVADLELGSTAPGFQGLPSTANSPWVFDNAADGTGCFGGKDGASGAVTAFSSLNLSGLYTDTQNKTTKNATVTCSVVPGTGIYGLGVGGGGTGSTSTPTSGRAVTILGSAGASFSSKSTGYMIHGDIVSKGPITGDQITTGKVSASSCDPTSGQAGTSCPFGGTVDDPYAGVDPNITSVPTTLGTWSGCTFQPGYYFNAIALTNATNACSNTPAIFAPGNYYFDFHNNPLDPTFSANSGIPSGSDVWTVANTVIGGQATGSGSSPGLCKSPINDTTAQGVQFIFGGDSRMTVNKDGILELCGSYNNGKPPLVMYGLDGSSASRGLVSANYASTPTAANSTASTVTSPLTLFKASSGTLAAAIAAPSDGTTADWSGIVSPSLNLSSFGSVGSIPVGSTLSSMKILVRHTESVSAGKKTSITPTLTYQMSGDLTATTVGGLSKQGTMTTETPDVSSSSLGQAVATSLQNGGSSLNTILSGLKLTFGETVSGTGTASVDQIQLVINYFPPTWRGETTNAIPSNCVTALSCDLFGVSASGGSGKGSLVVNGVTYLPAGSISANIGNNAGTIAFRWGLVANTGSFSGWPQSNFIGFPLISIPDPGPGLGGNVTAVDLKVYLCNSGTCATTGTPALTARVMFTDPIDSTTNIVTAAPSTRQVNVLSWAPAR